MSMLCELTTGTNIGEAIESRAPHGPWGIHYTSRLNGI